MKPGELNSFILSTQPKFIGTLEKRSYEYLLNNNVLYYLLSKKPRLTPVETVLRSKLKKGNRKYKKTLRYIKNISMQHKINFLLFKTHKYINEAYTGDVDIVIKSKDIQKFNQILKNDGFNSVREQKNKYELTKSGHKKVEVRSNLSFHGSEVVSENELWSGRESAKYSGIEYQKTSKLIDVYILLLNVLFGPKYLDLYLLKVLYGEPNLFNHLITHKYGDYLQILVKNSLKKLNTHKFPYFPSNVLYLKFWFKEILLNEEILLLGKLKHFLYFFYIKYKYLLLNYLEFAHRLDHI